MKFSILLPIIIILTANFIYSTKKFRKSKTSIKKSKKKQIQIVNDHAGFGSSISQVVRKTPSINIENRLEYPTIAEPLEYTYFSNSNTSSQPNIGEYGKLAEIVNPTVLFHSNRPLSVVEDIPAHLGYQNIKHEYTARNKATNEIEKHEHNEKVPIYGTIQAVKNLNVETVKPFDLQFRRFRKPQTTVHDVNAEVNFQADRRIPL
jgi:hypothetical protein